MSFESFTTIENLLLHETEGKLVKFTPSSTGVTSKDKAIIVDWMITVHGMFKLKKETLFQAVNMLDVCIPVLEIKEINNINGIGVKCKQLQLYSVVCLFLACKKYEIYAPEVADFIFVLDGAVTEEEIRETEVSIIKLLHFDLEIPNITEYNTYITQQYRRIQKYEVLDPHLSKTLIDCVSMYVFHGSSDEIFDEVLPSVLSTALFHIISMCMVLMNKENVKSSNTISDFDFFNPFNVEKSIVISTCRHIVKQILRFERSTLTTVTKDLKNRLVVLGVKYKKFIIVTRLVLSVLIDVKPLRSFSRIDIEKYLKSNYNYMKITNIFNLKACKKIETLGSGTYSTVKKITHNEQSYAVKINADAWHCNSEGLQTQYIREVSVLLNMKHECVIALIGVLDDCSGFVLELMDMDLKTYYERNPTASLEFQYTITKNLLSGLVYMHSHGILNRDIKPQNILVRGEWGKSFEIKYCDFGLTRGKGVASSCIIGTHEICTMWYRPIELLLGGSNTQGPHIDIWCLACTLYEIFTKQVLFRGESEIDQIHRIFRIFGTPSKNHPLAKLPEYKMNFPKWICSSIHTSWNISDSINAIIKKGLEYDPEKRPSASILLQDLIASSNNPSEDKICGSPII